MKVIRLAAFLALAPLVVRAQEPDPNVNERYTVESVEVTGIDQAKLDREVRENMHGLVGRKFSQEKLDELSRLVHKALPGRVVSVRIRRGDQPESLKIIFEIHRSQQPFDLAAPKLLFHSRNGFAGEVDATVRVRTSSFMVGAGERRRRAGGALRRRARAVREPEGRDGPGADGLRV